MKTRCAIYTRKSTEEGLDQGFNSLDAQFEACAAYITSQRHEGWKQLSNRYDDGGVSGGKLDRPGLQRLLADIDAGRVDMVVVYKIDRLTRSLADFAKLVERMEVADCSFVSVTQSFNTSSSMGRLTLNMLLSFAQFEREVTAERIRDKIAASKKKGLWMGGLPPLGYEPHPDKLRRELVVNETEAHTVRRLFELYLENGCLNATSSAADTEGLRSKYRTFSNGRSQGGNPFSRGQIYATLTNPIYRGLIQHKKQTFTGTHPAIIDDVTWEDVQTKLQIASAKRRGANHSNHTAAPLLGKFRDEAGERLTPTHTNKNGRRIHYYVSHGLVSGKPRREAWRLPASEFENAVAQAISQHFAKHVKRRSILRISDAAELEAASENTNMLVQDIHQKGIMAVCHCILVGSIARNNIHIKLDASALAKLLKLDSDKFNPDMLIINTTFSCRRRGQETKIVAGDAEPVPDKTLVKALRHAQKWSNDLKSGIAIKDIAKAQGCSDSYTRRIIPLATLSPRLQQAILNGSLSDNITLETFIRADIPLDWKDQEARFGLSS